MTRIAQFAKFTAKPGHGGDVVATMETALAAARLESGTEVYAIHVAGDQPDVVWVYELYSDTDAHAAHSSSAATAQMRTSLADLLAEPTVVLRSSVHAGFGLPHASGDLHHVD